MKLEKRLRWFFERKLIMLFLWEERFLNPLIPDEMSQLKTSGLLEDEDTLTVLEKIFPEFITQLPTGMYFPVPISKAVKQGNNFTIELAIGFHTMNNLWSFLILRLEKSVIPTTTLYTLNLESLDAVNAIIPGIVQFTLLFGIFSWRYQWFNKNISRTQVTNTPLKNTKD